MSLIDMICLAMVVVGAALLFCRLADLLYQCEKPSDEEIEAAVKRINHEFTNRPRI